MSESPPQQSDPDVDRMMHARNADLAELLGHVVSCWDDERRLLARQMHDSLGSSLTALTMHLTLLAQQMPAEKPLQDRASQMKKLLMAIIHNNRDMQVRLWNDKLEFLGIKTAISELVSEFGKSHAIAARASLPDEDSSYPRLQGVALLRCLEEGLRNVAAHAAASEVDVILDDDGDTIMLTLRDNGVGPGQAADAPQACHGLRLLRERAHYLGGAMRIGPGPERGTVLTLTLPRQAPTP